MERNSVRPITQHVRPLRHVFSELGKNLSGSDQFCTRVKAELESEFFLALAGRKLAFDRELWDRAIAGER